MRDSYARMFCPKLGSRQDIALVPNQSRVRLKFKYVYKGADKLTIYLYNTLTSVLSYSLTIKIPSSPFPSLHNNSQRRTKEKEKEKETKRREEKTEKRVSILKTQTRNEKPKNYYRRRRRRHLVHLSGDINLLCLGPDTRRPMYPPFPPRTHAAATARASLLHRSRHGTLPRVYTRIAPWHRRPLPLIPIPVPGTPTPRT